MLRNEFWSWADHIAANQRYTSTDASSTDHSSSAENSSSPEFPVATPEIIQLVKAAYSSPFNLALIIRYSTMLDNEFYKTLHTLREEQEWRLKTIEGSASQSPNE